MIPLAEWAPDQSPYNPSAAPVILNAIPKLNGYGPVPSLDEISTALPSQCLGAISVKLLDGNHEIFAGTRTNLYKYNSATKAFDEISKATDAYSVPVGDFWGVALFGEQVIFANVANPPQVINASSGVAFADLAGNPPQAKHVWTMGDHLVLGNLASDKTAVHSSGVNDAQDWDIGGVGRSNYQVMPEGGEVMGAVGSQQGAIVLMRHGMQALSLTFGGQFAFTRQVVNKTRGAIASKSVVELPSNEFVFLSDNGFYRGVNAQPIGFEKVNEWFIADADTQYLAEVVGVRDPYEEVVWWAYRRNTGQYALIGYHYILNKWTRSDAQVNFMAAQVTDGVSFDELTGSFDEQNRPFDDRALKGGVPVFAAFTSENKMAYFTGLPMAFQAETSQIAFNAGGRAIVTNVRSVVDTESYKIAIGKRDAHGASADWTGYTTPNRFGECPVREDARLHTIRIAIDEGVSWKHCDRMEVDVSRTGA